MIRGAIPARERLVLPIIFLGLLVSRLCHLDVLWVEECYPAAAAIQILYGKALYSGVWFDKPPLSPYVYLLWGARTGVPLRIAGAVLAFLCCIAAWRFARSLWGVPEANAAAMFLAFFLTFGIPAAVIPLAPDLLMMLPHTLAVYLAWRGRPLASGLAAGVALLLNPKAVFVLAACALWAGPAWPLLLAGFLLPNAAALAWFGRPYFEQVWQWGALYSGHGFALSSGVVRTANWLGFHAALVIAAAYAWRRERSYRMLGWVAVSAIAVAAGWRFFPRYYFQLLPPLVLLAGRGFVLLGRRRAVVLALLLIPLVRFGPRYALLANDLLRGRQTAWSDVQMNRDSRVAAQRIGPGGDLLVWGYRPDIFVYTRLPAGTPFLDSQPLTGVLADRHLTNADVVAPELAARNRQALTRTSPTWVVDGLGPLNPALAISNYPDLREWLKNYRPVGATEYTVIYRRR